MKRGVCEVYFCLHLVVYSDQEKYSVLATKMFQLNAKTQKSVIHEAVVCLGNIVKHLPLVSESSHTRGHCAPRQNCETPVSG